MENKLNVGDALTRNPAARAALALCVVVAGASTGASGLALGCVMLAVLLCGNLVMSILGKLVPRSGHFAAAILAYTAITACAQIVMNRHFAAYAQELGIFLPLCGVAGVLSGEIETSCHRCIGASIWSSIRCGVPIAFVLVFIGAVRELLGLGTLFGSRIMCNDFEPVLMAQYPAGGFILAGVVLGLAYAIFHRGKGEAK